MQIQCRAAIIDISPYQNEDEDSNDENLYVKRHKQQLILFKCKLYGRKGKNIQSSNWLKTLSLMLQNILFTEVPKIINFKYIDAFCAYFTKNCSFW